MVDRVWSEDVGSQRRTMPCRHDSFGIVRREACTMRPFKRSEMSQTCFVMLVFLTELPQSGVGQTTGFGPCFHLVYLF